jgi:multidrug efflux pump subunit AcrA (membrane-fusion protein)
MSSRLDTIKELLGDTEDFKSIAVQQSAPPRIIGILGAATFIIIPLAAFALLFVPWQQVSTGNGKVIAYAPENRLQTIEAPVSGRLARWLVHEGQVVKKGAPLVELADNDPEILSRLERQYEAMKVKLTATEDALRVSKINLERQRELEKKGLSSRRAYELALLEVSKFESEVSSARATVADTEVKLSRQASQTVQADRDGIVTRILAPQGGIMVSAGDSLAVLVPDTNDRAVELYVTGNDLPLITADRKVRLQFEGWPAVQFTGWPSVAIGTFGGVVKFVDQADDGKGNYRVLVFPDPTEQTWPSGVFLRQGVRTVGWIILDRVSLGWEIWRRLNGFPVSISNDSKSESAK